VDVFEDRVLGGRGSLPKLSFAQYLSFVGFFPQLASGPISTFRQSGKRLAAPQIADVKALFEGTLLIVLGLFHKCVLSSLFALYAEAMQFFPDLLDSLDTLLGLICCYLSLYFDFSGYSDIAVGTGLLFGVRLPLNFNRPLSASTFSEFWSRWHISLTGFVKNYLYFGTVRAFNNAVWSPAAGLVLAMLGVALWHGIAGKFIAFGLLHSAALILTANFQPKGRWLAALGWAVTQLTVAVSMAFFVAPDLAVACKILLGLAYPTAPGRLDTVGPLDTQMCAIAFIYTALHARSRRNSLELVANCKPCFTLALTVAVIASVALLFLSSGVTRTFVYANF